MHSFSSELTHTSHLTFSIAEEDYAVPFTRVREIVRFDEPTRVPHAASVVRGVINVRGNVVLVLELAVLFGWPRREITPRTCVVLFNAMSQGHPMVVGVVVDEVREVVEISEEMTLSWSTQENDLRSEYLRGVRQVEDATTFVLDVDRILSEAEFKVIHGVRAETANVGTASVRAPRSRP